MKYTIASLSLLSTVAAAHPGHDHSSAFAPLLHALWLSPVAFAIVGAAYLLHKKYSKK